ncbi:hypothetical protein [Kitasatospora sp. NPDC059327]|uniref:hypothetical protein n=1 Tax=Kitasatospora sp. NPDC059327 TaxID=3346803 RepID=UPI003688B15D
MHTTAAFVTIAVALGPRATEPSPTNPTAALRRAEAATTGRIRDLWGFAAAAVEAAGDDTVSRRGRELWATAADYARRAADLEDGAPAGVTVGAGRA